MIENSFYTSEFHGDYDMVSIGRLDLEEGGSIPDCLLAVDDLGRANEARDNAILITTWYSGTHQIWRDVYVGPSHALNPERYFIVAINQIGNGLSISPHNAEPNDEIAMSRFPKVRIGDDVVAQERLLREHFGIERLELVIGGSMGAQQTYEWAVRFPDKVLRAAPIAGTAQNTPHDFLFTEALSEQISVRPGLERRGVHVQRRRHRRAQPARAHLGGDGLLDGVLEAGGLAGAGVRLEGGVPEGFLEPYFTVMDPNDLLSHGVEVAARRRQPGTPVATWPPRSAGSPRRPSSCRSTRTCSSRRATAVPSRSSSRAASCASSTTCSATSACSASTPTYMPQIDQHLGELLATDVP